MKPIRLRARNLRTFPDLDIEFGEGLVGILGELRDAPEGADSNGAGKSTLLEAIDIALFGRRSLAGYLTRGGDVDELMIELTFEHGDSVYRIRRTYSARGRGKTSVDLEQAIVWESDGPEVAVWDPLTQASSKETDAFLCDLLGLSKETFRDSGYLRQGDGGYADPDRDPRQRKELLVEAVLGRDPVWPRLAELAKTRRKAAQAQLERIHGETETLRGLAGDVTAAEYEAKQIELAFAVGKVELAERELARISGRYQEARDQAGKRQALEAELANAQQTLAGLNRRTEAAAEAVVAIDVARDELDTLTTPGALDELVGRETMLDALLDSFRQATVEHEQARRDHETAKQRRDELLRRANDAKENAEKLWTAAALLTAQPLDESARCDHCGQLLDDQAREQRLAKYRDDAAGFEADARALSADAAAIALTEVPAPPSPPQLEGDTAVNLLVVTRAAIARARDELAQRARLEERVVQLKRDVEQRPAFDDVERIGAIVSEKQSALDELEPVDLVVLEQAGARARQTLTRAQAAQTAAVAVKARADERAAQAKAAEEKLAERTTETTQLQADVDRDLLLERCYGRDGIPALIIENSAIPYIETEASRILSLLGTSFQVELRTQTENKTGGLRDTLQVVVIDQDGNEADYTDGCSGGEQTRVGLALRIALARLLSHRRGAESRLLALDEPSYLDQAGMAALLDVLRGLESDFDVILLVSHVPELRDALDQTVVVVKESGRSRIDGVPVPVEAVAA